MGVFIYGKNPFFEVSDYHYRCTEITYGVALRIIGNPVGSRYDDRFVQVA